MQDVPLSHFVAYKAEMAQEFRVGEENVVGAPVEPPVERDFEAENAARVARFKAVHPKSALVEEVHGGFYEMIKPVATYADVIMIVDTNHSDPGIGKKFSDPKLFQSLAESGVMSIGLETPDNAQETVIDPYIQTIKDGHEAAGREVFMRESNRRFSYASQRGDSAEEKRNTPQVKADMIKHATALGMGVHAVDSGVGRKEGMQLRALMKRRDAGEYISDQWMTEAKAYYADIRTNDRVYSGKVKALQKKGSVAVFPGVEHGRGRMHEKDLDEFLEEDGSKVVTVQTYESEAAFEKANHGPDHPELVHFVDTDRTFTTPKMDMKPDLRLYMENKGVRFSNVPPDNAQKHTPSSDVTMTPQPISPAGFNM